MNPIELQNAFEIEMNRMDSNLTLSTDRVFYFINEAAEEFVKERIGNNNIYREGLEQTQKRMEDLRSLIRSVTLVPTAGSTKPNSFVANLQEDTKEVDDYFYTLDEEVDITVNGVTYRQGITEVTSDTYRSKIDDVYSEHKLQYNEAKPLRLNEKDSILLIGDGNYTITNYYLRYLKLPNKVDLDAYYDTRDAALPADIEGLLDLPDHTHSEVIKIAVRMAIENQTDVRYQSYINEVNNIE